MATLLSTLGYQPRELRFGTSGRRGAVVDLTQLEIYINVIAELEYLKSLAKGGIRTGDDFYFAYDLRPSSGAICQAVVKAVHDAGMKPVNLGPLPTPALTACALARKRGSIMVTGSHIPFDLNGYKLNTSVGEILKEDEAPIGAAVARVRQRIYEQPSEESLFDDRGQLRSPSELPAVETPARADYIARYVNFFGSHALGNKRILAYQHSAVGRDVLVEILTALGADVVAAGRSEEFVAIDTEAIDDRQLATIQSLADAAGPLWAVVSTDGDSDRPLILGVEAGKVVFFPGDVVGMVVAEYLNADAVVVPISCNDAIDRGALAAKLEPKTKIGSPHVIAGMAVALKKGRQRVCGWEANGGFLLGSDIERNGRVLTALPTRDAMLPIAAALCSDSTTLTARFAALPRRFSRAALLRNFPRETGRHIVDVLSRPDALPLLRKFFPDPIAGVDYTDGVRILFENGEVAHFRPSGNADEFRLYAVADTPERASAIVAEGLAEPDGIIRRMERSL